MTSKTHTRHTRGLLRVMSDPKNNPLFRGTDIYANAIAIPAYILALAKTGQMQRSMLRFPEGEFYENSVTLWSPPGKLLPMTATRAVIEIEDAEDRASRVSIEIDEDMGGSLLLVRMFFLPSGKHTLPIRGVIGMVDSSGVRLLRFMTGSEFHQHLPK